MVCECDAERKQVFVFDLNSSVSGERRVNTSKLSIPIWICPLYIRLNSKKLRLFEDSTQFFCLIFRRYDVGCDGFLDLMEMKIMMEKLGAPQTHIGLKGMIAEVDEDNDGKISFREFMLIYR